MHSLSINKPKLSRKENQLGYKELTIPKIKNQLNYFLNGRGLDRKVAIENWVGFLTNEVILKLPINYKSLNRDVIIQIF
jgi:hypothetical protein